MITNNANLQLAQSASSLGAGFLGFGIGAMWGLGISNPILFAIMIVGGIIHIAGMYIVQMKNSPINAGRIAKTLWITAWICLLFIVGFVIYLMVK